ncbi:lipase 3-like [Anticarsia gemmatalis]|uniref:lipase 3-like n=1 Tax=Anticarsia gemmatalis TaxID=129554 RepID=UPI003F771D59
MRKVLLCVVCVLALADTRSVRQSSIVQKITSDGFPSEVHRVTTIDGYNLEIHRIPYGRSGSTGPRPLVFLMHGLMADSMSFIMLGPELSVAYNLADAGFDVWMGNARGNSFSRSHVSLNPDGFTQKYSFFDFTFEEIAIHDVPTMMDYALEYTGNEKLHYIGHSQGGTVFLVLGSIRPEYNAKIASAHLLAGVGYMDYFPNEELATAAANVDTIYSLARLMGIVELFPDFLADLMSPQQGYTMADYCTGDLHQRHMCELIGVRHLLRENSSFIDDYVPSGASLKQAAHYGQNIRDKSFRRYHFGRSSNLQTYGLEEPPIYNISLITTDVTMHYTVSDILLDERDVLAMAADMPNTRVRKVARETFLHEDFVAATDAKELVTDYIIGALLSAVDIADDNIDIGIDDVIVVDHTTAPDIIIDDVITEGTTVTPVPGSAASAVLNMYLVLFSLVFLLKRILE